jgi:hypothetical protein
MFCLWRIFWHGIALQVSYTTCQIYANFYIDYRDHYNSFEIGFASLVSALEHASKKPCFDLASIFAFIELGTAQKNILISNVQEKVDKVREILFKTFDLSPAPLQPYFQISSSTRVGSAFSLSPYDNS